MEEDRRPGWDHYPEWDHHAQVARQLIAEIRASTNSYASLIQQSRQVLRHSYDLLLKAPE